MKRYIKPETFLTEVDATQIICASVTDVGGDAGIERGNDDEAPNTADARHRRDVWDDEEEDDAEF